MRPSYQRIYSFFLNYLLFSDSALEGQQDSLEDTKDEPIVEITSTTVAAIVKTTTTTMQTTTMDFCNPDPCNNNGICANDLENNKFTCDCTETGFEGDQCEINIDDCQPESCNNNGICEDLINDFSCKCNTGYDGEQCQNDINECADNPCLNNGVCLDEIGKFSCNCSGTGYEVISFREIVQNWPEWQDENTLTM